jgi:ABC-2 type transport system ATP-binding protein
MLFLNARQLSLDSGGQAPLERLRTSPRRVSAGRLRNIDLTLRQGQVTALLGPNGAGKSTLLQVLAGVLLADRGTVSLEGMERVGNKGDAAHNSPEAADTQRQEPAVAKSRSVIQSHSLSRWNRLIGYMPEHLPVLPRLRVKEVLQHALYLKTGASNPAVIDRVMQRCQLSAYANQPVETLSLGYRQRLGLARALVHEPPVLLLDEPMNGLDPEHSRQFIDLLSELKPHHLILLTTHLLSELDAISDRILVMNAGQLAGEIPPLNAGLSVSKHNGLTTEAGKQGLPAAQAGQLWRMRFAQPVSNSLLQILEAETPVNKRTGQELIIESNPSLNRKLITLLPADSGLFELSPVTTQANDTTAPSVENRLASVLCHYRQILAQSADMESSP